MSPLAKVFVVVNLILSIAFFGSSATLFSTRVNWRERFEALKAENGKQLDEAKKKWEAVGTQIVLINGARTKLNADYNSVSADKNKIEGSLNEAKTKNSQLDLRIDSEVKEKTQLTSRLQDLDKKNTDLTALLETARKEADDAKGTKENAVEEMTRFRVDLDRVNDELVKARIEYKDLKDKADSMRLELEAAIAAGFRPNSGSAPPINAIVQAVKAEDKLVVLSVGLNQKVQEGFEFTIYRGDKFIGKVRVVKVWDDLAGAQILYTSENDAVQVGDKAATQI